MGFKSGKKRHFYIPAFQYYFYIQKGFFLIVFKRRITVMDFKAILAILAFCTLYYIYHYSSGALV
ncbi:hypothetical protein [Methanosarcina sp. 2.H.A.1B.4]|uniref:hypothetical protein n=1 Tax=Methanosarcina sp. 2.H.A.1B.4 TaxID=1483600 RepID=UPI0012E086E9|nr:hypothetical protein [Methanosarcina sp. 2.H.A.1B.4]